MVYPALDLPRPSWLGVLLGYGLLLLSLSCFTLFVVNSVVPLVSLELGYLLMCLGLFLLAGTPAFLFLLTPRALGGPLGAYLRLYARMLAAQAPTAPMPWARYAGLYNVLIAGGCTLLFAGAGEAALRGERTVFPTLVLAYIVLAAGLLLMLAGAALLGGMLRQRIRRWQAQP